MTQNTETADRFPAQHDREPLEAKATSLTGLPATAGDTYLAFLATLTPVRSGPIRFTMHSDAFVEGAYVDCPSCGRSVGDGEVGNALTLAERIENLLDLVDRERSNLVARLLRRATGICGTCGPDNRSRLAREKWESRPADFVDPDDRWDDDEPEDDSDDQDEWVYGGWK